MTSDGMLERSVDGRTNLVWDYVAQGHAPSAQTPDGVKLVAFTEESEVGRPAVKVHLRAAFAAWNVRAADGA